MFVEKSNAYFNFINSLNSESTRKSYEFCIEKLLNHRTDLESLLKLWPHDIKSIEMVFSQKEKISKSYINQILSALEHGCEMNNVILSWMTNLNYTVNRFEQIRDP